MRVAFTLLGGAGWTGGRNYLRNLLSSIALASGPRVEPVLFTGTDVPESELAELRPLLASPPFPTPLWNRAARGIRFTRSLLLQRDRAAEELYRDAGIDLVFQHSAWHGLRFGLPTLAWIADFQHRSLPGMFSWENWLRREAGYWGLSRSATALLLSSEDARRACERFYPSSRGRTEVLPFAVGVPEAWSDDVAGCRARHALPERYLYMPNQFWKHKNHAAAVEAMRILVSRHPDLVLVMSGALVDGRHPGHPREILAAIQRTGLQRSCRVLGVIPYGDVLTLARGAVAVVNPSFSEGWSTTVEEAKTLGTPLVLSDLAVHREQVETKALFFDPRSPEAMAEAMAKAWTAGEIARPARDQVRVRARERMARFGEGFGRIAQDTVARFGERSRNASGSPAREVGHG
ncbi:MAG TPA: glycosyltransferase family 1 protein [Candidatus Polarisedimenticolia bacterium]|nr:glycosyltransferase family 1 protein [Candidatus Polarisedimenticolia bacterium]